MTHELIIIIYVNKLYCTYIHYLFYVCLYLCIEMKARLEQDIEDIKSDYDRRLRSLRQEHEKVKIGYESRIELLLSQQSAVKSQHSAAGQSHSAAGQSQSPQSHTSPGSSGGGEGSEMSGGSSGGKQKVSPTNTTATSKLNLAQATQRIK